MKKYLDYIVNFQCNNIEEVKNWINSNLTNYLKTNQEKQDEIEHILDFLCSNKAPKRLLKMSYEEAVKGSEKWLKTLIKTNKNISENENDTEIVLSLENGFKWVKLVSETSYKNEGLRMKHCVGSYFGKNVDVYSLRDKNNEPHCTVEKDKQIKGKGNGNIHPKYIGYVVSFLEYLGMAVSDNEMKNLGYFNCSEFEKDLHEESLKLKYKNYLPISSKLKDKEGNVFFDLDFITLLDLIDSDGKIVIDLKLLDYGVRRLIKQINSKNASIGYNSKNASSGNYSQNASSGDNSQNASSGYNSKNASSGDNSEWIITGNNNVVASIGIGDKVRAIIGTWVTLAEYAKNSDKIYECVNVVSKRIDGEKLKENVFYSLIGGEFTEVD